MSRCENGTEDIISTRSKAFASLNGSMDDLSTQQLARFIQRNPSVLKRPIILSQKSMVVGYDDDEITAMVPYEKRYETEPFSETSIASVNVSLKVRAH